MSGWERRAPGAPIDDPLVARLCALIGPDRVEVPARAAVPGRPGGDAPRCRVSPETTEDLARVLTVVRAADVSWDVAKGGMFQGEPAAAVTLCLARMSGLLAVDETSLLATAQTGITFGRLEALLGRRGLTLGPIPRWLAPRTVVDVLADDARLRPSPAYGDVLDGLHALVAVLPGGRIARTVSSPRRATGAELTALLCGAGSRAGLASEVQLGVFRRPSERPRRQIVLDGWDAVARTCARLLAHDVRPALWHAAGPGAGPVALGLELRSEADDRRARACLAHLGVVTTAAAPGLAELFPEPAMEPAAPFSAPVAALFVPAARLGEALSGLPAVETYDPGATHVPIAPSAAAAEALHTERPRLARLGVAFADAPEPGFAALAAAVADHLART